MAKATGKVHITGLFRLARLISSRPHCPKSSSRNRASKTQAAAKRISGWPALRALNSKSGSSSARQSNIARHDHGEGQFLEITFVVFQTLQQALHPGATQCDEAVQRTAPDWQMFVTLGASQHRQRPRIAQLRQAVGGPTAHRQIGVSQRRPAAARCRFGRRRPNPRTVFPNQDIVVVQKREQKRNAGWSAYIGQGRWRRAGATFRKGGRGRSWGCSSSACIGPTARLSRRLPHNSPARTRSR